MDSASQISVKTETTAKKNAQMPPLKQLKIRISKINNNNKDNKIHILEEIKTKNLSKINRDLMAQAKKKCRKLMSKGSSR